LQNIALVVVFFAGLIAFVAWFSMLPRHSGVIETAPRLELSLSGAIGTNIVLTQEDAAKMLIPTPNKRLK
jgi:hypothetical protein